MTKNWAYVKGQCIKATYVNAVRASKTEPDIIFILVKKDLIRIQYTDIPNKPSAEELIKYTVLFRADRVNKQLNDF